MTKQRTRPVVQIVGDVDHADFREAAELLRSQSVVMDRSCESPELIVVAQSRPGVVSAKCMQSLQQAAPLAGIISLVGSWCEGESRTGRPFAGALRLYWHEFPGWWRRQLALCRDGRCADWAKPDKSRLHVLSSVSPTNRNRVDRGVVLIDTPCRETAAAIGDLLLRAGCASAWQSRTNIAQNIRGAVAAIWEGGQLNDCEAAQLARACRRLAFDDAPVIALLDFPRRDSVDRALELGVCAVLGKPWFNHELLGTLQAAMGERKFMRAA